MLELSVDCPEQAYSCLPLAGKKMGADEGKN